MATNKTLKNLKLENKMRTYFKECKTIKQANAYLKKLNLEDFGIDEDYFDTPYFKGEEQIDQWIDESETKGVSITYIKEKHGYDLFVEKYTPNDLLN